MIEVKYLIENEEKKSPISIIYIKKPFGSQVFFIFFATITTKHFIPHYSILSKLWRKTYLGQRTLHEKPLDSKLQSKKLLIQASLRTLIVSMEIKTRKAINFD